MRQDSILLTAPSCFSFVDNDAVGHGPSAMPNDQMMSWVDRSDQYERAGMLHHSRGSSPHRTNASSLSSSTRMDGHRIVNFLAAFQIDGHRIANFLSAVGMLQWQGYRVWDRRPTTVELIRQSGNFWAALFFFIASGLCVCLKPTG